MSVEASGTQGWQRWAHAPFGLSRFGISAPFKHVYAKFGFTVENLTKQVSLDLPYPLPSLYIIISLETSVL